jgi:hypothetical protein
MLESCHVCQNLLDAALTASRLNCHSEFLSSLQTVWKYEVEKSKQFVSLMKLFQHHGNVATYFNSYVFKIKPNEYAKLKLFGLQIIRRLKQG